MLQIFAGIVLQICEFLRPGSVTSRAKRSPPHSLIFSCPPSPSALYSHSQIQIHKCTNILLHTGKQQQEYLIPIMPSNDITSYHKMCDLLLIRSVVRTLPTSNDIVHPSESNTFSQDEALKAIQTKASNQQCASNNTPTS